MRSGIIDKLLVVILCVCAATAAQSAERVIYVDAAAVGANDGSSWADGYHSLQDGLATASAAPKPVEIRVARGVYKPDQGTGITAGDQSATFQLLNGVTLKGGYAGSTSIAPDARDVDRYPTVLSGDLEGNDDADWRSQDDNVCRVVTCGSLDPTAAIDGFTVTDGAYSRIQCDGAAGEAVADMLIDGGSPRVSRCQFVSNLSSFGSRGALLVRGGGRPVLTGCTFSDSESGLEGEDSSLVLTDCRFVNNREGIEARDCNLVLAGCRFVDDTRGIDARDCDLVLTGCTFERNRNGIDISYGALTLDRCTFTYHGDRAVRARGDASLSRCSFVANSGAMGAVEISGTHVVTLDDCEFVGNSGSRAGAVQVTVGSLLKARNCVFAGNAAGLFSAGAITHYGRLAQVSNCTFVGNRGNPNTIHDAYGDVELTQCVIRDGPEPFSAFPFPEPTVIANHCNVEGGYPGEGNIDVDPCFVETGYWDPNGTPDDLADDVWITGDYHLRSQAGHWDRDTETWVRDDVTSPCIDAGDPNGFLGSEPFPNGGFVNLGAYGGTLEASRSYFGEPVCENQIAGDINGDCRVDQTDIDILLSHWLMEGIGRVNTPPTIAVTSPADGAEITYRTPIVLRADAFDSDGALLWVTYVVEYRTDGVHHTGRHTIRGPYEDWELAWEWSNIHDDGLHTIWAETVDNEGVRTVSSKIEVVLHPRE